MYSMEHQRRGRQNLSTVHTLFTEDDKSRHKEGYFERSKQSISNEGGSFLRQHINSSRSTSSYNIKWAIQSSQNRITNNRQGYHRLHALCTGCAARLAGSAAVLNHKDCSAAALTICIGSA
eukprot:TRINITY_DN224_c1_g1_i2.p5 TRINITY_DN224_c1_g1~~TRINITY_DN224_c1_g1_i2.p5  ORF type:complete len:121 (-),score=27.66 TRINITY_DN224_c1_g1_i2:1346-1708(-)